MTVDEYVEKFMRELKTDPDITFGDMGKIGGTIAGTALVLALKDSLKDIVDE